MTASMRIPADMDRNLASQGVDMHRAAFSGETTVSRSLMTDDVQRRSRESKIEDRALDRADDEGMLAKPVRGDRAN